MNFPNFKQIRDRERRKLKKKNGVGKDDSKYRDLRKIAKKLIKNAYEKNNVELEENLAVNPNAFWSYVKQKKDAGSLNNTNIFDGQPVGDPNEITEKFADHFSSVYVHDTPVVTPWVAEVK